ncbi:MAG TPA: putative zinc-binding protein [Methanospirillum sp.]|uniref:putative zinc-binding protein n=1 Tax=Methanospirillum sp. TaxID=45200 RepID=UPI002C61979F|nr:putative zinc-binding protein [Methanospirillum sp.]HOJ95860.1 putative zinc-binding protein [Methanospirillum sp.]HOL40456.1 putative zinc-binding protein [Methanospirillum sp.]HPP79052.1 putative zinc-binding protein [Methanospirillum sp.]
MVTCSGISNTGKLTTKVSESLHRKCPGLIECSFAARSDPEKLRDFLAHAKRIVIVDGCSDCCGRKKIKELGYDPDIHIVATECGIIKNGMEDPRFDEIELMTSIVREKIR